MKRRTVLILVVALSLAVSTSCTSMKSLKTVRAGYDIDGQDGWASRYIPGVKALSKLIPPPSDARRKWDERYNKWNHQHNAEENAPEF